MEGTERRAIDRECSVNCVAEHHLEEVLILHCDRAILRGVLHPERISKTLQHDTRLDEGIKLYGATAEPVKLLH